SCSFLLKAQCFRIRLHRQFHTEAKVFFAREGESTCFQVSSQCAHPFPQTSESQAWARCVFYLHACASLAQHLCPDRAVLQGQCNETMLRATVADDVGHSFAYRPGKCGIQSRWKSVFEWFDLHLDPRCFQELPRSLQLACELWLPISGHGLAHFT